MNPVFILIVMIGILSSIANKKRKEEMKRKANQAPPYPPQHSPGGQTGAPAKAAQSRPAASASHTAKPSTRGVDSKGPGPAADERAKGQTAPKQKPASAYAGTPRYTHVVTSTLEGGHTHTESSLTGEEDCPPVQAAKPVPGAEQSAPAEQGNLLGFDSNSILQGVLYAQILGKPKAIQRN